MDIFNVMCYNKLKYWFLTKGLVQTMTRLDIKRAIAGICAASMLASFTACGENTTWGAVIDDTQIPAGVFIAYLQTAYYEAQDLLDEINSAEEESVTDELGEAVTTAELTLFEAQLEGMSAKEWILNEATKDMQEFVAVESKFDEYGLELSDEDEEIIDIYCEQYWEYYGEYYIEMGISQDSFRAIRINNTKRDMLFNYIYSEEGELALTDDELKAYLDENYAMINYIDMELKDGEGNLLKSDGKAERMAMAEEYIERFNNGEDLDIMLNEYEAYYEGLILEAEEAAAEAEQAALEEDAAQAEVTESDAKTANADEEESTAKADETEAEVTEAEAEAETEESAEADDTAEYEEDDSSISNKQAVTKDSTTPTAKVISAVFEEMAKGEARVIESDDGEHYYVVVKLDILETDDYFNSAKESLLYEMKSDEFEDVVSGWTEGQTVEKNQDAYDRYDPEKIFG